MWLGFATADDGKCKRRERELRDERAAFRQHLRRQFLMIARIDFVHARAEHAHRAPAGFERAAMRRCVYAARKT